MRKVMMLALVSGMTLVAPQHAAASVAAGQWAVSQKNLQFNPFDMTVAVGDTVTWTNHETDPQTIHSVVQTGGTEIDSPDIPPNTSFSWTFVNVEDYQFHCRFHPDMFMTLHVLDAKAAAKGAKGAKDAKSTGKSGKKAKKAKTAKTAKTAPAMDDDAMEKSAAKSKPAPAPGPPESTIPGIAGLPFSRER
jgi:plastocyanin